MGDMGYDDELENSDDLNSDALNDEFDAATREFDLRAKEEQERISRVVENADKPIKWQNIKPMQASAAIKRSRQMVFLKALAEFGTLTQAAKVAKINPSTHRGWLDKDPWFREQFKDALQQYRDLVAEEIHNRAIHGVEVPIVGKVQTELGPEDRIIGTKTVKSDLLLMFHAKRVDPSYRDDHQPVQDDKPVESVSPLTRITITLDTMESRRVITVGPDKQALPPGDVTDITATDVTDTDTEE